jgi:hypothetical protein
LTLPLIRGVRSRKVDIILVLVGEILMKLQWGPGRKSWADVMFSFMIDVPCTLRWMCREISTRNGISLVSCASGVAGCYAARCHCND